MLAETLRARDQRFPTPVENSFEATTLLDAEETVVYVSRTSVFAPA